LPPSLGLRADLGIDQLAPIRRTNGYNFRQHFTRELMKKCFAVDGCLPRACESGERGSTSAPVGSGS
jgi:hypothetical protein